MPVRLKDVANELGVSVVTVSKVLRGTKDVGEETRAKILRRLRELNYQPNMMARGLATGRSFAVGLIVPDLVHPFFAELAKSVSVKLRESGRALIMASSEEDNEVEMQEIRTLLSRGVDVLLLASCRSSIEDVAEIQKPVVLIDRNFAQLGGNFVGTDDLKAGEIATDHLASQGRKTIAHIGGDQNSTALCRMRGYQNVLERHGLSGEGLMMLRSHFEETGDLAGYQCMQTLLSGEQRRPDAVFCYNDLTAIGAIKATLEAGLRVPEDVAFVGCGNMRYSDYLQVPLSSVDQNTVGLGEAAANLVLELDKNPKQPPQSILIEPKLVVRRSSR